MKANRWWNCALVGTVVVGTLGLMPLDGVRSEAAFLAEPRTIYVDRSRGDGAGPGTRDEPFAEIGQAVAIVRPGDRVEVASGAYDEALDVTRSGTEEAPIVLAAAPDADVRIEDNVLTISASFVTLDGLTVESADDDDRGGIFIAAGQGITLRDLTARENEGAGLRVKPTDGPITDLTIIGGSYSDNDGAGIAATGEPERELRGLRIEGVTAHDNNGDGIQIERATDVSVVKSETTNNGEDDQRNGVFLKTVSRVRVSELRTGQNGHNGLALRQVTDVAVARSISTENGHHGFDSIENSANVSFVNNVSYANGDDDEDKGLYVTASSGVTVLNNIFAANAGDQIAVSDEGGPVQGITSDHNLFWLDDGQRLIRWFDDYFAELTPYQAASGLDARSFVASPEFADADEGDFTLEPDSPALDAGTVVAGVNSTFTGSAPDLGAVESGAAQAAVTRRAL